MKICACPDVSIINFNVSNGHQHLNAWPLLVGDSGRMFLEEPRRRSIELKDVNFERIGKISCGGRGSEEEERIADRLKEPLKFASVSKAHKDFVKCGWHLIKTNNLVQYAIAAVTCRGVSMEYGL
ncbi:hypothetical protein GH714_041854 [Hevea brasiliensis]|uniref:Uncharacterized protein n=1 Tax=Hevea brasiliensis TaxID=3981 RepID=A0A6A6MWD8_HEVBR|nr:hypothetical protein GH714_041837 [Hevea brasiliensis]KAF2316513.1 hypothetical protein GH714_041854 [Hevea brasiliensis]